MSSRVVISKRLLAVNTGAGVLFKFMNLFVLLWVQQFLLTRIGPEEYSLLPIVMAVVGLIPMFASVLTSGLSRYVVEAAAQDDEKLLVRTFSSMLPVLLLVAFAVLALAVVLSWNVTHILNIPPGKETEAAIMMMISLGAFACSLPLMLYETAYDVRQKYVLANILYIVNNLIRLGLLLWLLFGFGARVLWVVLATASADLIIRIVKAIHGRSLMPELRFDRSEFSLARLRELASFGVWNFVGNIVRFLKHSADPFLLNHLATALDVTCFHFGGMFYRQALEFILTALRPVDTTLVALHARDDREGLRRAFLRGSRLLMWVTWACAVPLIIFRREVFSIYIGDQYLEAATVMGLLIATLLSDSSVTFVWRIAPAMARVRTLTLGRLGFSIVNIGLTVFFLATLGLGATGSALATFIVALAVNMLFILPLGIRLIGFTAGQWLREAVIPGSLPGLAGALAWLGAREYLQPDGWLILGLAVCCGWLVYLPLMYSVMKPDDRSDLAVILTRSRERLRGLRKARA